MQRHQKIFLFFLFFQLAIANPIGLKGSKVAVIAIPGMHNRGAEQLPVSPKIFNLKNTDIFKRLTTKTRSDLGQKNCLKKVMQYVKPLQEDESVSDIIFYACSQGTATAIKYTALYPQKIRALFLESVVASSNQAILEYAKGIYNIQLDHKTFFQIIAFLNAWIFDEYNILEKSSYEYLEHVPKSIPIFMMHSKDDPAVFAHHACAAYVQLCKKGHEAYLYLASGQQHLNILAQPHRYKVVQAMNILLKKHDLPYFPEMIGDESVLNLFAVDASMLENYHHHFLNAEEKLLESFKKYRNSNE